MFERYTEKARRTIFFARYEASSFGSPYIEVQHLLLGLLRESPFVREFLQPTAADTLREKLRAEQGQRQQFPTSVDLPLSHEGKRMLALAAEEADDYGSKHIDCAHLFAGLFRLPSSISHDFLREQTGDLEQLLMKVRNRLQNAELWRPLASGAGVCFEPQGYRKAPVREWLPEVLEATPTPAFAAVHRALTHLLLRSSELLDCSTEAYGDTRLHRRPWSRKEAIGRLIDCAAQHRLWLARALAEGSLPVDLRPSDEWMAAQHYGEMPWAFVVDCWFSANSLLVRVIAGLPDTHATLPFRIGVEPPATIEKLLSEFVGMSEDIMEQVLAKL